MKKLIFILFMFFINIIIVIASPPAPTSDCYIKGVIKDVIFIEAYNDTCIPFNDCVGNQNYTNCCPSDYSPYHPAQYVLEILIDRVETIEGTELQGEIKCEDIFEINTIEAFYILESKIFVIPQPSLIIEGIIKNPTIFRRFDTYTLKTNQTPICGNFTRNGKFYEGCAVCGDSVCEEIEKYCSWDSPLTVCQSLYCPQDCQPKENETEECTKDSDCPELSCIQGIASISQSCINNKCTPLSQCPDTTQNETRNECVEKDKSCCVGDNCSEVIIDCVQGYKSVFQECDANCQPVWECEKEKQGFFSRIISWFKRLFGKE